MKSVRELPWKRARVALIAALLLAAVPASYAQTETEPWMSVYGFAQLDMIYDNGQNHPDWFDVIRPTKLPSFENEFGHDGHFYGSVRQSRLGVKAGIPSALGEIKTIFEFELFGTGVDAGQTTFRLRHAWAELGAFGGGQTWSPFMDIDVFPNSLEYWGPNGMVFFRNVQVRWQPIQGDTRLSIALERPGASADQGEYGERIALQGVTARFPWPDLSGEYRYGSDWGYVEAAGMLRYMEWNDNVEGGEDISGDAVGWGINLSSNIKLRGGADILRLQYVVGEGIQNYMNDAPADVGVETRGSAIDGVPLPMQGVVVFLDHTWNDKVTTAIGYSSLDIDNSNGQSPAAFKQGQYGLVNVLYTPVKNFMVGGELQYGDRRNFEDGFTSDTWRVQFSIRANFSSMFGGKS